jgi:uncharacterized protein (DUF427 family)
LLKVKQLKWLKAIIPRSSVKMEWFSLSPTPYTCPWKGKAEYFNISVNAEAIQDIAWSYPTPKEAAKNIAGHLAFDRRKGVEIMGSRRFDLSRFAQSCKVDFAK